MLAHVAVVDRTGAIVFTNHAWRQFAVENGGTAAHNLGIGANYLAACRTSSDDLSGVSALDGIQRVLSAEVGLFEMEYPCHSPSELRWFIMQATQLAIDGEMYALIVHQDVTRLRISWTAYETERVQATQHASSVHELESLEALSRGAPTTLTARSFGLVRLSEGMPALFTELVDRYAAVLDLAMEQRTYKIRHPISAELRIMAERLGFARSGPRDIIDIHTVALRTKLKHGPKISHAYFEESRVLLLELMGYLVSYYRTYATGPGAPVSNISIPVSDASD
jgi:hypothetical protein